jgi:mono/diheme cytochrome c family protein
MLVRLVFLSGILFLFSCSGENKSSDDFNINDLDSESTSDSPKASMTVDLLDKGVGPVTKVEFEELDDELADSGKKIFNQKCIICHKINDRLVGPALKGVLKRRSPEWVMNMILNPDVMIKENELARNLYIEFNGSPMSNQGLTEEEARAVLEFLRTLD